MHHNNIYLHKPPKCHPFIPLYQEYVRCTFFILSHCVIRHEICLCLWWNGNWTTTSTGRRRFYLLHVMELWNYCWKQGYTLTTCTNRIHHILFINQSVITALWPWECDVAQLCNLFCIMCSKILQTNQDRFISLKVLLPKKILKCLSVMQYVLTLHSFAVYCMSTRIRFSDPARVDSKRNVWFILFKQHYCTTTSTASEWQMESKLKHTQH